MEIATRKGRMKGMVNKERRTEGINIDDSFFFFSISISKQSHFFYECSSHNFFFKSYAIPFVDSFLHKSIPI